MPKLLLVDDEESLRLALKAHLRKQGWDVVAVGSAEEALTAMARDPVEFLVTDVRMPGRSGLELVQEVRKQHPNVVVIVMSAYGSHEDALQAIQLGATDYLTKPFAPADLAFTLRKVQEREVLVRQNRELRAAVAKDHRFDGIVARSEAMRGLFATIARVANFKTTVLITGETGVGKELVARSIHKRSPRAAKSFVAVNCGAIPENLIESELFGHKKGAFTDANADKRGLFEEAQDGTLFLDEITDLPLALQVKLLRVLQEGSFRRLGETHDRQAEVRIVAASARDLGQEVKAGRFREDLYFRLNVVSVTIPPLRQRKEDVGLLVDHFVQRFNERLGTRIEGVDPHAMRLLQDYPWPGNVRELEHAIERAMVLSEGSILRGSDLDPRIREPVDPIAAELEKGNYSIKQTTRIIEEILIRRALDKTKGNRTRAAELLEISHRALLYKIKEFGIA
ncbi:MAG: sigma-54-dependent Fis family transcriptional regulator [Myxococcales bacterium]|nr:sigma-54-dependent Fis family transcriptional regulator [Myxococcales bacterium]